MTERQDRLAFTEASDRVRMRLTLIRWLDALGRSAFPFFLAAISGLAWLRLAGGRWSNIGVALLLVSAWAGAAFLWAVVRRPTRVQSLAAWDDRANRNEMFVSAYCFEVKPERSAGERLHLEHAGRLVDGEMDEIGTTLPLPRVFHVIALPLIFTVFAGTRLLEAPVPFEDRALDGHAHRRALATTKDLSDKRKDLDELKGLTEEEKKKIKELKKSLRELSAELAGKDELTARQLLDDLEARAREAEKLAESLESGDEMDLSEDLLGELERHADLAGLGSALREKDAGKISSEASKIAQRLKRDKLSIEERKRIRESLKRALAKATAGDRKRSSVQSMSQALRHLSRGQHREAANRFSRMAQRFSRRALRQRSRLQVQQLVRQLRRSGRNILGQGHAGGMRRLAPSMAPGLRSMRNFPQARLRSLPFGRSMPGARGGRQTPSPMTPRGGRPCGPGSCTPVPGAGRPGSGMMPGAGMAGSIPVPGAGQGGRQAGTGSAPMGNSPTKLHKSTRTGAIGGVAVNDGPSEVAEFQGGPRREQTRREKQESAIAFIKAEEEALAEEPLPASRHEQVIRYFKALRSQIERDIEIK